MRKYRICSWKSVYRYLVIIMVTAVLAAGTLPCSIVSVHAAATAAAATTTAAAGQSTAKQGFVTKKGKTYYLDEKGKKVTGLKKLTGRDGKKHTYYFNKKGVMQTGFQYIKSKNRVCYFLKSTGAMLTGKQKLKGLKGYTYNFDQKTGALTGVSKSVDKMANKKLNQLGRSLKRAYEWSRTIPYKAYIADRSKGTAHYAKYGFKNGTGNCYVKAATFTAMARQLGYPVRQVGGYCRTEHGKTAHSWVEIYYKGKWRVCDPSWGRHGSYMSGWMIHYGQKGTWVYLEHKKLKN
ncbi:MAG: hypothetical protein IJI10_09610 [Eubacterium sp.]|nr:hypothetical protein [Eubacterium sp.]